MNYNLELNNGETLKSILNDVSVVDEYDQRFSTTLESIKKTLSKGYPIKAAPTDSRMGMHLTFSFTDEQESGDQDILNALIDHYYAYITNELKHVFYLVTCPLCLASR